MATYTSRPIPTPPTAPSHAGGHGWRRNTHITISGKPQPKQRPRVANGHAYTPAATLAYARRVVWAAREAGIDESLWAAPLKVTCWFYLPDKRRRDGDNLLKGIVDPLIGVVFKDDSQIVEWHAYVHVDRQNPRAEIEIVERKEA